MYYAKRLREDGSIEELHNRNRPMDDVEGLIAISEEEYRELRASMIGEVPERKTRHTVEESED